MSLLLMRIGECARPTNLGVLAASRAAGTPTGGVFGRPMHLHVYTKETNERGIRGLQFSLSVAISLKAFSLNRLDADVKSAGTLTPAHPFASQRVRRTKVHWARLQTRRVVRSTHVISRTGVECIERWPKKSVSPYPPPAPAEQPQQWPMGRQ